MRLRGVLHSIEGGQYSFRLSSDDGAMLWVGDNLTIDNDGVHAVRSMTGTAYLAADRWVWVMLYWYNVAAPGALYLEWKRPGQTAFEAI